MTLTDQGKHWWSIELAWGSAAPKAYPQCNLWRQCYCYQTTIRLRLIATQWHFTSSNTVPKNPNKYGKLELEQIDVQSPWRKETKPKKNQDIGQTLNHKGAACWVGYLVHCLPVPSVQPAQWLIYLIGASKYKISLQSFVLIVIHLIICSISMQIESMVITVQ